MLEFKYFLLTTVRHGVKNKKTNFNSYTLVHSLDFN